MIELPLVLCRLLCLSILMISLRIDLPEGIRWAHRWTTVTLQQSVSKNGLKVFRSRWWCKKKKRPEEAPLWELYVWCLTAFIDAIKGSGGLKVRGACLWREGCQLSMPGWPLSKAHSPSCFSGAAQWPDCGCTGQLLGVNAIPTVKENIALSEISLNE